MFSFIDSDDEAAARATSIGAIVSLDDEDELSFADSEDEAEIIERLKSTAERVGTEMFTDSDGEVYDADKDAGFFKSVMEAGQDMDEEDDDDEETEGVDEDAVVRDSLERFKEAERKDQYASSDEIGASPTKSGMFNFDEDDFDSGGFVMSEMAVVGSAMLGAPGTDWKDDIDKILPQYPDALARGKVGITTSIINGGMKQDVIANHGANKKMRFYIPTDAAWKSYQTSTGVTPAQANHVASNYVSFMRPAGDVSAIGKMLRGYRYVANRKIKTDDGHTVYELPLVPDLSSPTMVSALRSSLDAKRIACSAEASKQKIEAYKSGVLESPMMNGDATVKNADQLYADITGASYGSDDPRAQASRFLSLYEFLLYSGRMAAGQGALVFAVTNEAWDKSYAKAVRMILERAGWIKKLSALLKNHVSSVPLGSDVLLLKKGRDYLVKTNANPARFLLFNVAKIRGRKNGDTKFVSHEVVVSFEHPTLATTSVIVSDAPYTIFLNTSEQDAKKVFNFNGAIAST